VACPLRGGPGAGPFTRGAAAARGPQGLAAHGVVRRAGQRQGLPAQDLPEPRALRQWLRVYGIDQDEQGEYPGRFYDYLQGSRVSIRSLADAEAFGFDQVHNPDVVMWDLHESDDAERGLIFAELKAKLCAHLLATRGRAALIVDEAVTVTEDEHGRKALGDLNRRGRHFGLEMHVLTQRVTDWFDTQIGRTIQNTSANQWYGQLEPRELHEMAASMGFTPEKREKTDRAGQGEGLLVTAGRRVWVTLHGHTAPAEFEAVNTDREPDEERRNGDVPQVATLARR
jgi:hypothetical protein